MKRLLFTLLILCSINIVAQQPTEPRPGKPITIPTRYFGDRFYALPVTQNNVTLVLFTDSAGSIFLNTDLVAKLGLATETVKNESGRELTLASLPSFKPNASIPLPLGSAYDGRLFVFPPRQYPAPFVSEPRDGMLGQQWFAERVWTFDYPGKTLLWRAPNDLPAHDKAHEVQLWFKANASGKRINNFARIQIEVDGEPVDFVLDTGATNILSDEVLKQIGDRQAAERATSFLVQSVYDKWHAKHPEWKVLENIKTLTGSSMIEAPQVKIGGFTVGPVWFTVQPDAGFQGVMGSLTDKRVSGALGGSALHYFRMTVDWPNALAVFERP
jgi:hypothetical protein